MRDIGGEWLNFLKIVVNPWIIVLIISTVFLGRVLLSQTDPLIVTTLTFVLSLTSGVVGGVIGKRWEEYSDERVIVARGKSAVRNLKLLLGNVSALEAKIRQDANDLLESAKDVDVLRGLFKQQVGDTIGRCTLLAEHVVNSIENWTDVLPDAAISTQIGQITELKAKEASLAKALESITTELAETKNKSKEETQRLKEEQRQLQQNLNEARQKVLDASKPLGTPFLSSGGTVVYPSSFQFKGTILDAEQIARLLNPTIAKVDVASAITIVDEKASKE